MANKTPDITRLTSLTFMLGRLVREGARANGGASSHSLLHFEVLQYVKENRQPTMRDIARYLLITPPAATLLIDSMVKKSLLVRILDKNDRRAVRVGITEKGKRFIVLGIKGKTRNLKDIFSVLNPKERAQLIAILQKVTKRKTSHP